MRHPELGQGPSRRLHRPAPVAFRPLISGPVHRPRCRRPDPDRPLGPNVTKVIRALQGATYLKLFEEGAPSERLLPLAISISVDEFIDQCTAPAGSWHTPSLDDPGGGDADQG